MSREIKFRAWHLDWKSYFEKGTDINSISYSTELEMIDFDRVIWEQYTGLKDFNGVEIYEGDVLKDVDDSTIVGFVEYDEAFGEYDCGNNNLYECTRDCVVTGNIHANPELLEE